MNLRLAASAALLLALAVPSTALAWPFFDVTASEVLSVDPPRVKTTFTINETGPTDPGSCGWAFFLMHASDPSAPDAPQFFSGEGSGPWECVVVEEEGVQNLVFFHEGGGDSHHGDIFSIVTDRAEPCVHVQYGCVVLMGWPSAPFDACLAVDMPVPAAVTSWGAVKSIYR